MGRHFLYRGDRSAFLSAMRGAVAAAPSQRKSARPVVPPADLDDVMWEQFAYLMELRSKHRSTTCDCSACERYLVMAKILLEPFSG